MLRIVSLSLLAAISVAALAIPAEADHRRRHIIFPLIDIFPGGWDDDEYAYYYDDEDEPERYVPRKKRNLRAEEPWWLYEDDEDLEPVVKPVKKKKKAQKKTAASAAKPARPVLKPEIKPLATTSASAATLPEESKPKAKITSQSGITVTPPVTTTTATAKAAPPDDTKSIACTAGAAVVTGYGFADVKPKTCTGKTYTYSASRGGKSFLIELTASSGEVVDVKKL
jgi:hypothetical protein